MYVKKTRKLGKKAVKREKNEKTIILDSWNKTSPVSSSFTETQTSLNATWYIDNNDINYQFRNCFDYHLDPNDHYESSLKIEVECKLHDNRYSHWECAITHTDNRTKVITEHFKDDFRPNEINVDLQCKVVYRGNTYLFNHPVVLGYNITQNDPTTSFPIPLSTSSLRTESTQFNSTLHTLETPTSTSSPETVTASITISVAVMMLSLVLSVCVVMHYKKNANRGQAGVLSKIKWENNPNYLETLDEVDGPLLPEWLSGRKEMIFDQSCIEKGEKSWHGHFGSVYEARIRLGNAV